MLRHSKLEPMRMLLPGCLLLAALQQLGSAGLVQAKAQLAPVLIERAWNRSLAAGGVAVKPWSWADTWPVARLQVPGEDIDRFVLAGDSGNVLAFGPGHSSASAPLGEPGLAVIGGHRDTHFAFLADLPAGAHLSLQLPDGRQRWYRVSGSEIVDSRQRHAQAVADGEALQLVTCYPFDSLDANGPLRYVVTARPVGCAMRSNGSAGCAFSGQPAAAQEQAPRGLL